MMHWLKSSKKTCGPDLFPHQKLVLLVWLARLQLHSRTQTKGLWIYVGAPVQDALSTQHPWSNPLRSREKCQMAAHGKMMENVYIKNCRKQVKLAS